MGTIPHSTCACLCISYSHRLLFMCVLVLSQNRRSLPLYWSTCHFLKASNVPGMPPTLFSAVLLLSGSGKRERRGALIDWFGKANNKDGFLSTFIWPFQSHFESHSTLAALFQGTNRLVKYRESPFPFISRALAIIPFVLRQRDKYTNPITQ